MLSAMDWSTGIATALLATAVPGALIVGYLNRKGNDGDKTRQKQICRATVDGKKLARKANDIILRFFINFGQDPHEKPMRDS